MVAGSAWNKRFSRGRIELGWNVFALGFFCGLWDDFFDCDGFEQRPRPLLDI